ncbi:MAG: hypothetical protein ACREF0_16545, partial [Acetobacteraceae bacterium]
VYKVRAEANATFAVVSLLIAGSYILLDSTIIFAFYTRRRNSGPTASRAAKQDDADGQKCLGDAFGDRLDILKDEVMALHWCRKADNQGSTDARACLDDMYTHRCIPSGEVKATHRYHAAAEQGSARRTNVFSTADDTDFIVASTISSSRGQPMY